MAPARLGQLRAAPAADSAGAALTTGRPAAGALARTSTSGPAASRESATVTCPLGER